MIDISSIPDIVLYYILSIFMYFMIDIVIFTRLCIGATDLMEIGIPTSSLPLWVLLLLQYRLIADHPDGKR